MSEARKRCPYTWGSKAYLTSMEVGEIRVNDGRFNWRHLAVIACAITKTYGSKYSFSSANGVDMVKRIL